MRIRHKPWAKPELEACPFYIETPKQQRGHWADAFPKKQPLRLELGCGKGGFLAQEATAHPDYNYIAIDIKNEMLVLAKRKLEHAFAEKKMATDSIRIFTCNLMLFSDYFSPEDRVDRIYINFCNPWPRSKHKKRRLTHLRQLVQYRTVLDGEIWFKTDDDLLFEESIPYFEEAGFQIVFQTRNLHQETGIESFQTEHEAMFDEMGKTIKFLIAKPMEQNDEKERTL
jgi:tRNA (guanine-N7-)-methyltransferase